jgi:hypothetical protein
VIILATTTDSRSVRCSDLKYQETLRDGCLLKFRIRDGKQTRRSYERFSSAEEFESRFESMLQPKSVTWVIGHSVGSQMITTGLLDAIKLGRFRPVRRDNPDGATDLDGFFADQSGEILVLNDPPVIVWAEGKYGARFVCLDVRNWFDHSLERISELVDFPLVPLAGPENPKEARKYDAYSQCETLERWFLAYLHLLQKFDGGSPRWTVASQAMAAYQRTRRSHTIRAHQVPEIRQVERESYFGGETRVFRFGKVGGRAYSVDVNSLFPSVMLKEPLPQRLLTFDHSLKWREGNLPELAPCQVSEVYLETSDRTYPKRYENQVLPCKGRFSTVLVWARAGIGNRGRAR